VERSVDRPSRQLRQQLRALWEAFTLSGDASPLTTFLAKHAWTRRHCGHEYPYLHRIGDVILEGRAFRVARCTSCGEELSFEPLVPEQAAVESPGAPYWLTGDGLKRWTAAEAANPSKASIDWDAYR
jgi:hypothetical protein